MARPVSLPPIPRARAERILWSVLEEHFEDAQFLFTSWEQALDGPDESLRTLATGLERRFAAHVRGLVHGGLPVVERLLFPAMRDEARAAFDERAQRATAALAILAQPVPDTQRLVVAASEGLESGSARHLQRALQLWDAPDSDRALLEASRRSDAKTWPLWLQTFAIRGQAADDDMVDACLRGDRGGVLAGLAVAPTMAASAGAKIHAVIDYFFASEDPELRVAALRAGLVIGSHRAHQLCRDWSTSLAAPSGVTEVVGLVGNAEEHRALIQQVAAGHVIESRIWALGLSGRPRAAHLCVQLLRHADERVVRLAFEAFCAITGLAGESPEVSVPEPRPGERDLEQPDGEFAAREAARDAAIEADRAAGLPTVVRRLPLPKPEVVEAWWTKFGARFEVGRRYLHGRPTSLEVMHAAYLDGPSRRRHALGFEITLRTRNRVRPSTRAFAARQLRQLAALTEQRFDPQRGYLDR